MMEVLPFIETTEIMKHKPLDVHEEPWFLVAGTDQWMVHLLVFFSPLVNVYITIERSTIFQNSTISTGQFSSSQTVNVYQAGYPLVNKLVDPENSQWWISIKHLTRPSGINTFK